MMKAAWYGKAGAAREVLQVGERPFPTCGPSDVLVALRTSGINPSDVKARAGTRGGSSALAHPWVIPHSDGAGVVAEVGAKVRTLKPGDRVWVANGQWQRAAGTAAQYIALDESLAFALPTRASFETGATLGIPAITACHATLGFGPMGGKTVLVSGGAGTVGRMAVQFARSAGAKVIATGHGARDRERALGAGAESFFDYASPDLVQEILAANSGQKIDHIVEVEYGSNAATDAELVAPRGTIVAYGSAKVPRPELPFYNLLFKGVRLEFLLVYLLTAQERSAAAARINALIESGQLDTPIHAVFPLERCAEAHESVEGRGREGAVILDCRTAA